MNIFTRIAIILVALGGIVMTVLSFSLWAQVPEISRFSLNLADNNAFVFDLFIFFAGVVFLAFLILLFYAIFAPGNARYLTVKTPLGKVRIARSAIEDNAKEAVCELADAKQVDVKVKLKKNSDKIKIKTQLLVDPADNVGDQGVAVHERIDAAVTGFTGQPVKKIKVAFKEQQPVPQVAAEMPKGRVE